MKGGRTAPRNYIAISMGPLNWCFNEGGADCPPKLRDWRKYKAKAERFNEGGADCPPKPQMV